MKKASFAGLSVTAIIYLIVGILGFAMFGRQKFSPDSKIQNSNILILFDRSPDETAADVIFFWLLNLSFIFSVLFNVVLMFITCKNNFFNTVVIIKKIAEERSRGSS